ncbi:hypothetical protein [Thermomonospora umbrina]|uniref:Neocarzinostatin family protein n=1 Tax=Thermomonospora umbrina TaxID=111806 RepID=A0A3D9T255_9ACTN|nr:hypothetical protein [Thermomonospora umbrina]REE99325.1 hypothetical protein DFJ69_4834 [Thermomonospora umbrina]
MAQRRRAIVLGTVITAACATIGPAASASSTSSAGTTAIERHPEGGAYSGPVQARLLGTATVSTSLGDGQCGQSTLNGSINADGTGLTFTSATFGGPEGCGGDVSTVITAQNLPWTGGGVVYAPSGTRDGTVTIAGFRVRAVVQLFGGITCTFGGTLTASGYNPDNPNRPVPEVDEAQVAVNGAPVTKVSPSGFLCPATATVTATYALLGQSTPGVFDQSLKATGTP